jgi:GTP pyrophosphokinase
MMAQKYFEQHGSGNKQDWDLAFEHGYTAHVLGVTAIALEYGANETEAIGALLHDTVEDCGGAERLRDIREKFGDDVARIVDGCTDTYETPKPPWMERKRAYIEHLKDSDCPTRLVSASDKLHNTSGA